MPAGLWVLIVAIGGSALFGLYRMITDGTFADTRRLSTSSAAATDSAEQKESKNGAFGAVGVLDGIDAPPLGEKATLVQFSSALCAPCRATRIILGQVAELVPGVVHVEIDAEQHLELVRRLDILRTPTTVILNADGNEISRASGVPKRDHVLAALATAGP